MSNARDERFTGLDGALVTENGCTRRLDGKPLTDWDRFVLATGARDLEEFKRWRKTQAPD